ncbi:MAG: hypothetical protein HZB44_03185 [Actinobacteria bacterium]|nr:hypothetical protein [Actinomycetota bacterium]
MSLLQALDSSPASAYSGPLNVDPGFFGINAERPFEDVYNSDALSALEEYSGSYSIEATVKIRETSSADGSAGLIFQSDADNDEYCYFGIYPNKDKWELRRPDFTEPFEGQYDVGINQQSYNLKADIAGGSITLYIDGSEVAVLNETSPAAGRAGIRIRSADADFSNVRINGEPQTLTCWQANHGVAWTGISGSSARGNVLLDPASLASPELSPELDAWFRMMDSMGARYVNFQLSWAEIQPESPSQPYSWLYSDAFAIAANRYNLDIVPNMLFAPMWAVTPESRNSRFYRAYPPVNDEGAFETARFSQFATAAADRYKRGGQLAAIMGWSQNSHGQADFFEVGPEFNLGIISEWKNGRWEATNAGWLGDLSQYVDLLKAGRDSVKSVCPACLVLNGGSADDSIPNYSIGDDPGRNDGFEPYLDDVRLCNPDGSLAWRQTVWQGIDDLYDEIERRPPPDNTPGRYFDVLNMHTFMWKGYSAEWPVTADRYVKCSYYSSECWQRWYEKRFQEVVRVMDEHNDRRDVWLGETGFPSARPPNDSVGFLGFISEYQQAIALQTVYSEAAKFPSIKKVFWWQGYDSNYTGNLGLIGDDRSAKAAYVRYGLLSGKTVDSRSEYSFTWYDDLAGDNWILMANPAGAASDSWFDLTIAGTERDLTVMNNGKVLAGQTAASRFPGVRGGPVRVGSQSQGKALASQRILWPAGGNSLEEVIGADAEKLSSHFYWTWYDEKSPGFVDWIMVTNPGEESIHYQIRVANIERDRGTIAPGAYVTPRFAGIMDGPVEVEAWADSVGGSVPARVMASQRVLSNDGRSFNEVPGIPEEELGSVYQWTWYDQQTPGAVNWVLLANPASNLMFYLLEVGAGGCDQDGTPSGLAGTACQAGGPVGGGQYVSAAFPGIMNGPVTLKTYSDPGMTVPVKSVASQRSLWGPSFEEVPGFPIEALNSNYHWTWYDQQSDGVSNWILMANPSTEEAIDVEIWMNGKRAQEGKGPSTNPTTWTLTPGQTRVASFGTYMGGPVEVRASLSGNTWPAGSRPVFASQRVLWNGYFNEVWGTALD